MSAFAVGEEAEQTAPIVIREVGQMAAPLDAAQPILAPGSTVRLDVVVRTRKIGHFFPGGTVDAFDVWLEVQGRDADGRMVFWSGQVEDEGRGPVEPGAHFYRSYQLDGHGNPIDKRNAWQTRSLLYVRLIPPGAADVAHYRVRIPEEPAGRSRSRRSCSTGSSRTPTRSSPMRASRSRARTGAVGKAFDGRAFSFDPANIPANVSGRSRTGSRICRSSRWPQATAQIRAGRRDDAARSGGR